MSTTCAHRRRLWVLSRGPRVSCPFGFCDDCGEKIVAAEIERLVKEAYPDRSVHRSLLEWTEQEPEADGWQLACDAGWIKFVYPGKLVSMLIKQLPHGCPAEFYRSWLDD